MNRIMFTLALVVSFFAFGCRGTPSKQPPLHLVFNMDDQPKYQAYERSNFFADQSAMRMPVEGTVARGDLPENPATATGRDRQGNILRTNPISLTAQVMERGRERYNIYCTPCHGASGNGKGIVAVKGIPLGLVPPTSLHEPRLRYERDGYLFDVMTRGIRNMASYRHQISTTDRWAIVHYVRALQRSQHAPRSDVPVAIRKTLQEAKP